MSGEESGGRSLAGARLAYFTPVAEYPSLADRKAVAMLAARTLMASLLAGFDDELAGLVHADGPLWQPLTVALLGLVSLTLGGGVLMDFQVLVMPIPPMEASLVHFGQVSQLTMEAYRQGVRGLGGEEALLHQVRFNHGISSLSARKFAVIRRAMRLLAVSFLGWLGLLLLVMLSP